MTEKLNNELKMCYRCGGEMVYEIYQTVNYVSDISGITYDDHDAGKCTKCGVIILIEDVNDINVWDEASAIKALNVRVRDKEDESKEISPQTKEILSTAKRYNEHLEDDLLEKFVEENGKVDLDFSEEEIIKGKGK